MKDFDTIRTVSTHEHFTIFEAHSNKLGFPVILKQCPYTEDSTAKFYIRSALTKARDNVYSQPLVSLFTSVEPTTGQVLLTFVWKRGREPDAEIEQDRRSAFPSGKEGYGRPRSLYSSARSGVSVDRVRCMTLGREVTRKVFEYRNELNMNFVYQEALILVKCKHPNICELLDFRLFRMKKGYLCAYIVMERMGAVLSSEREQRKAKAEPYNEIELTEVLQDISAALLHAKAQGFAHRDIKPSNIFRSSGGFKLAGFHSLMGMDYF